jgi:hypothetical protein
VRRSIQIALLLLLLVHLAGAPFETIDRWDQFAQGGNDLVLSVLSVVAGLGLTLVMACLLRLALWAVLVKRRLGLVVLPQVAEAFLKASRPAPFTSPPLSLRI